jgi:hypothetical protein
MHTTLTGNPKERDQLGDESIDDSPTVLCRPILKKKGVSLQTRSEWAKTRILSSVTQRAR